MKQKHAYATAMGQLYQGESARLLRSLARNGGKESVQLIFTSPPFALNTKRNMET